MNGRQQMVLTILAAMLMLTCAVGIMVSESDDSDAALGAYTGGYNKSNASNPYSSIDVDASEFSKSTLVSIYVQYRASVSITNDKNVGSLDVTQAYGLIDNGTTITGNLIPRSSGSTGPVYVWLDDAQVLKITIVYDSEPENPVTSLKASWSLSSYKNVHPGEDTTAIITVNPSDATNPELEWELSNGNAEVTSYRITTPEDDGVGYRYWITIEGVYIGDVELRVWSVSNPSVEITVDISVTGWTCYLNYHPNGGLNPDGDSDEWWDTEVINDRYGTAEIPVTHDKPTRSGYTFLGWSSNPSASSPDSRYDPGDFVEVTYDDDFYLYAVWKSNTVYTSSVSISSSGGNQINIGDSLTLTATTSPSNASNRGATFSIQSGSQYVSLSGSSITSTGGKVTVTGTAAGTAVIKATSSDGRSSNTFSITVIQPTYNFNLIYASGCSDAVQNMPTNPGQATTSETTHSFTISSLTPTRNGYTFTGWLGSDGQTYQPGGSVSVGRNQTVTLTAQWVQNTYTCYINYNSTVTGHSNFPTNDQFTGTSTADHTFTISALTPTHPDYIFLGWATSNGGPVEKQPGQTIDCPYNGSVNLWAVWDAKQITITSEQSSVGLICGDPFSYTVETDKEGVVVSVSGASWLSVNGSTISGTAPNQPGTYDITVQVMKDGGYTTATQSFQIVVYSNIGFISEPSADGIYTYMMD